MRRRSELERERGHEGMRENLGIDDCHVIIAQAAYYYQIYTKSIFSM